MSAQGKTSIAITLIMGAAVVGTIGLMADCSKDVARVEAEAKLACVQGGGEWANYGPSYSVGRCIKRDR